MKTNFKKWLALAALAMGISVASAQGSALAADGPKEGHTYTAEAVEINSDATVDITWKCQEEHADGAECTESFVERWSEKADVISSYEGNCGYDGWVQYHVYIPVTYNDTSAQKKEYKSGLFITKKATHVHDYSDETLSIVVDKAWCEKQGTVIRVCKDCFLPEGMEYPEDENGTTAPHTPPTNADKTMRVYDVFSEEKILAEATRTSSEALAHIWKTTYSKFDNVKQEDGKFVLIDKTRNGKYWVEDVCERDNTHTRNGRWVYIYVDTVYYVSYNFTKNLIEDDVYKTGADGHKYNASSNIYDRNDAMDKMYDATYHAAHESEILGSIWTYDCLKDGNVWKASYNKEKALIAIEQVTIDATNHHPDTTWYENASDRANLRVNGELVPFQAKNAKVVNMTCAHAITYEVNTYCLNPYCSNYRKGTQKPYISETRTAAPGEHQFNTKYDKNGNLQWKIGGPHCKTLYKTCLICGYEEVGEYLNESMHKKGLAVAENRVEPSAHVDGHYDKVVYCDRCGDELSRQSVRIPMTNPYDFKWQLYYVWEGYSYRFNDNTVEQTGYFQVKDLTAHDDDNWSPMAVLMAVPMDDDIDEVLRERLKHVVVDEDTTVVKEDASKRVKSTATELGKRVYNAAISGKAADLGKNYIVDFGGIKNYKAQLEAENKGTTKRTIGLTTTASYPADPDSAERKDVWADVKAALYATQTYNTAGFEYKGKGVQEENKESVEPEKPVEVEKIDISKATISGSMPYRGEYSYIPFTVTLDGKVLTEKVDFEITNARRNLYKGVGWHWLQIKGIGNYTGTADGKLYITQGTNKVKVSISKKTFKAKALKTKAASFEVKVTKKGGSLKAASSNKTYVKVKKVETGVYKITVKKGTPKGTYKVTFTAAESKNYTSAKKAVKIVVK